MRFSLFFLFLFLPALLFAKAEHFLEHAEIYIDTQSLSFEEVQSKPFIPMVSDHINLGFTLKKSVWIRFVLSNRDNVPKEQLLEINNPLLEHIALYDEAGNAQYRGMLHDNREERHINPSFVLTLAPEQVQTYWLHVSNTTTALQFSPLLRDAESFEKSDKQKQFFIILSLGIISAFVIYALVLFVYMQERSYLYYSIYISTLLFQQLTYVGFLPLYMPHEFTRIDNLLVVPKVGFMIITAAIFARAFLKTENFPRIDRIYRFVIYGVALQILLLSTPSFYVPEVTILTGLFFIFLNLFSGIYVYQNGNKQARFFIAGWSFLIVGYFLSIIDALGFYSVMYHLPSLVMFCTILEALFLLLAFVDRLNILQKQKLQTEHQLNLELQQRNTLIEKEVSQRTAALKNLYKELHHRVKNNLQIILSIIRLQSNTLREEQTKASFLQLENRIRSIAKTHELLYQDDNIETIDMSEYIEGLCEDIQNSISHAPMDLTYTIDAQMPLREAVYVGLIVNELISNTLKHALTCKRLNISLQQEHDGTYVLEIADDGEGYESSSITSESLGLHLVNTLVFEQLNGTISADTHGKSRYDIRFKI